jgi:hypothetical protein
MSIEKYLHTLSDDIIELDLSNKNITELPDLSKYYKLTKLNISMNKLKELTKLPPILKELKCSNNKITNISSLPSTLEIFDCTFNKLKELPTLPIILKVLDCSYNEITILPIIPDGLKIFNCSDNKITELQLLPSNLRILDCSYNCIIKLPIIPNDLEELYCSYNELIILPIIPNIIDIINYEFNPIYDIINSDDIDIINKKCNIIRRFIFSYNVSKYRKQFKNFYYKRIVEPRVIRRSNPYNLLKIIEENPNRDLMEIIDNFENLIDIV